MKQAGTVILAVTLVLWLLSHIPTHGGSFPQLADSFIGKVGQFIEPVIRPLGFNWKIGIGLLTSVLAREVIVGRWGRYMGAIRRRTIMTLQAALRHDMTSGRRDCAGGLLRSGDAVHVDARGGEAGDQQLEVAGGAVCVYDGAGLYGGAGDQPGHYAILSRLRVVRISRRHRRRPRPSHPVHDHPLRVFSVEIYLPHLRSRRNS